MSYHPQPGDTVNTFDPGIPWYAIKRMTVAQAIKFYQRIMRRFRRPAWRQTHSRLYLGVIPDNAIEALRSCQLIDGATALRLGTRKDWLLSVTDPVVRFDAWVNVEAFGGAWTVCRPLFFDYAAGTHASEIGRRLLTASAVRLIGMRYDRGQLIDIFLNQLLGFPLDEYKRVFDFGPHLTVCSGGVAACYDHHRRYIKKTEGAEPFPRLFGGMYLERVCPALFQGLPKNSTWKREFQTVACEYH